MRRFASAWDALTIPDFLGSRFVPPGPSAERHPLRLAAAVVIAFSSLLYLLAIFKGAGHLFQFFFERGLRARGGNHTCHRHALHLNRRVRLGCKNGCHPGATHAHW